MEDDDDARNAVLSASSSRQPFPANTVASEQPPEPPIGSVPTDGEQVAQEAASSSVTLPDRESGKMDEEDA
eukprot:9943849-Karenia_brevis.AAC.1